MSALASNLASKNKQIHAASEAFNILMANVEPTTAFQPVISIAASSNPRVKAALFDRITDMLPSVAEATNLLVRHALPTALRAVDGSMGLETCDSSFVETTLQMHGRRDDPGSPDGPDG